jgi:cell division transport system permease protein
MKLGFFVKESLRGMRRNAAPSFAAFATIVVTLIVVGTFIPIVQAFQGAASSAARQVLVNVYMNTGATAAMEARVHHELEALPHVGRIAFESKQTAYRQQVKQDPAGYALLSANPLPDTFHVYPDQPGNALLVRSELLAHGKPFDAAVASVSNHVQQTRRVLTATSIVTVAAVVISILLVISSVLLIANTIRLSLFARRREVEVMKLVGATDWFIRWPFMIEGTIVGALGALTAVTLIGLVKLAVIDPLFGGASWVGDLHTMPLPWLVVVLLLAGIAVSAIGSGLSLRRFLRV